MAISDVLPNFREFEKLVQSITVVDYPVVDYPVSEGSGTTEEVLLEVSVEMIIPRKYLPIIFTDTSKNKFLKVKEEK